VSHSSVSKYAQTAVLPLTDDELFQDIVHRKASGHDHKRQVGELVFRWRAQSHGIIGKVQRAFMKGSPDDLDEIFQQAVVKFIDRGIGQFHGKSAEFPGQSTPPRAFFLRIVKHAAIDLYRRESSEVEPAHNAEDGEEIDENLALVQRAEHLARAHSDQRSASEEYWAAWKRLQKEHPNEAAVWDLYHHQELDNHAEVASILGITVPNSHKRCSRAQAWLKLAVIEMRERDSKKQKLWKTKTKEPQ
jgi:RNA polymerase sigma-70 factor, ECF subfamily